MDYRRIYGEFIADRRRRERLLVGYSERHHILPRCLGGGDETENLIRLTAEDHFFAHLLLAKIHGGKLASALQLLADIAGKRWRSRATGRRPYAFGQRLAARLKGEAWTGERNPLFKAERHAWVNMDTGEVRSATIYDMHREQGCRAHWTSAVTGARNTMKGWRLANRSVRIRGHKGKSFTFLNRDGRTFTGTQGAFARAHGLNLASASRIVRHESVTTCGWRLTGVRDRPANYGKDGLPTRQRR